MKDNKYSSIQIKTKQLLAWALSIQIAGVTSVIPVLSVLSSFSVSSLASAGGSNPVPIVTPKKDKKASTPPIFENDIGGHGGSSAATEAAPAKKKFCRDENGKWLASCTVAILLGLAAIIAIVAYSRKSSSCKSCSNPPPRPPGRPGRPGERPPPYPGGGNRPPRVPCCQNPAPAPAPAGGGTNETSEVVTGSAPVPGVEPIVVNP